MITVLSALPEAKRWPGGKGGGAHTVHVVSGKIQPAGYKCLQRLQKATTKVQYRPPYIYVYTCTCTCNYRYVLHLAS